MAPGDSKDGRAFEKLVIWVSALSIAVMAALLASLKQVNPEIQVRFSVATVIAFLAGGILTVLFLRFVLHPNGKRRAPLVIAAVVLSVIVYFFIGIKDTASENRLDVLIGTLIAVTVLSGVAMALWRVGHYFEAERPEDTMPEPK
jgi:peptidoglycan/LPS O-acetylase OafA/YrhL